MATIIIGKSLRIVRNDAKVATDEVQPSGRVKRGRPVTITGTKGSMQKYGNVPDTLYAAIVAESNPEKRNALLTNVTGKVLDGTRVTVTRDVFERFIAEHLAAVAADADEPTQVEREAARVRVQSFLNGGLIALPDGEGAGEDALGWAFGIAADDDDTDDGDDDGEEAAE